MSTLWFFLLKHTAIFILTLKIKLYVLVSFFSIFLVTVNIVISISLLSQDIVYSSLQQPIFEEKKSSVLSSLVFLLHIHTCLFWCLSFKHSPTPGYLESIPKRLWIFCLTVSSDMLNSQFILETLICYGEYWQSIQTWIQLPGIFISELAYECCDLGQDISLLRISVSSSEKL